MEENQLCWMYSRTSTDTCRAEYDSIAWGISQCTTSHPNARQCYRDSSRVMLSCLFGLWTTTAAAAPTTTAQSIELSFQSRAPPSHWHRRSTREIFWMGVTKSIDEAINQRMKCVATSKTLWHNVYQVHKTMLVRSNAHKFKIPPKGESSKMRLLNTMRVVYVKYYS